jgi:hypothetical protein
VAAWCDLDADGVNIVVDLSSRPWAEVLTVGMDVDLWLAAPVPDPIGDVARSWPAQATSLVDRCPPHLRKIGRGDRRDRTGQGREQETLQREVARALRTILERLWG